MFLINMLRIHKQAKRNTCLLIILVKWTVYYPSVRVPRGVLGEIKLERRNHSLGMTLLVWSTDIVGRLGLWPEDKQRRPGVGSRTTWLYHNYYYDSSYKYGHPMSVMEKVAVHIHALNEKVTNNPQVTATILPIASGLTIATKLWHWREDVSSPLQRNVHNTTCTISA